MSNNNSITENVLLLNMSTLSEFFEPSVHYYYKISNGGAYLFEGISQLEAGTKFILSSLHRRNETVDRIVITGSPQVFETNQYVNMSSMEFYIERIKRFISGGDEGEKTDGTEIQKALIYILSKVLDNTQNDGSRNVSNLNIEGTKVVSESVVINDKTFMEDLAERYKSTCMDAFFIPIHMEGVSTSKIATIKKKKKKIIGNADHVN